MPPTPSDNVDRSEGASAQRRLPLLLVNDWRNALREFVVVVAGVLAALAAQAWWDGHQERGREQAYLRQLLADTRENRRRLERDIAEDSAAGDAARQVLLALEGATPPRADSLVRWISRAGHASDFRPLAGTYAALLGTGDLRLVRNDSLRAQLSAYAAGLNAETQRLQQIRGATNDAVPQMARALPFMRGIFLPGGSRVDEVDADRLRGNPDVTAVLFTIQALNMNRLSGLRRLHADTERLLRALEAEAG